MLTVQPGTATIITNNTATRGAGKSCEPPAGRKVENTSAGHEQSKGILIMPGPQPLSCGIHTPLLTSHSPGGAVYLEQPGLLRMPCTNGSQRLACICLLCQDAQLSFILCMAATKTHYHTTTTPTSHENGRVVDCVGNGQLVNNHALGGGMGPELSTVPVSISLIPRTPTIGFTPGSTLLLEVAFYDALGQAIRPSVGREVAFVALSAVDGTGNQLNLLGSPTKPSSEPSFISLPNMLGAPGSQQSITIAASLPRTGLSVGTYVVRAWLAIVALQSLYLNPSWTYEDWGSIFIRLTSDVSCVC